MVIKRLKKLLLRGGKSAAGLDRVHRRRMVARHRQSLARFGEAPQTLFWASREVQRQRFELLAGIGIKRGDSLLDVGCGFGDLAPCLEQLGAAVDYIGIDLSPEIISQARRRHPELNLMCGELFDFQWGDASFDWVVLSGTLNWDLEDDGEYAERVISEMYRLCRKGVAFNMLDLRGIDPAELDELTAFDPDDVLEFCQQLTPDCELHDLYMDNDFTIYMRKTY